MQNLMAKVLEVATVTEVGIVVTEGAAKAGETAWIRAIKMNKTEGVTEAETAIGNAATAMIEVVVGALTGAWIETIEEIGAGEGALTGMVAVSGTTEETTVHPVIVLDLNLILGMGGRWRVEVGTGFVPEVLLLKYTVSMSAWDHRIRMDQSAFS